MSLEGSSDVIIDADLPRPFQQTLARLYNQQVDGQLARLENADCINTYATTFQSTHSNLMLITDHVNATEFKAFRRQTVFNPLTDTDPYMWICIGRLDDRTCASFVPDIVAHASDWTVNNDYHINYCLSEPVPEKCKLQYSLDLAIVVIIFNFVKAIVIGCAASMSKEAPMLTSGDVIASMMSTPEPTTKGMCLLSSSHLVTRSLLHPRYYQKPKR